MKKYILAAFVALASLVSANASNTYPYLLYVHTADGQTVNFQFSDEPIATIENGELHIQLASLQEVAYNLENVVKLTLDADPASVGTVEGKSLSFYVTADKVLIDGLDAAAAVAVYDVKGRSLVSGTADTVGHAEISLSGLGKGVYIVSTPKQSFKFIK